MSERQICERGEATPPVRMTNHGFGATREQRLRPGRVAA
jgi:hypothetical protein